MSILVEKRGQICIFTLDRPEVKNALDIETSRLLAQHFIAFRDDPDSWVAIITGAGGESFCAGGDLKKIGDYYASMTPLERRSRGEIEPGIGGITRNLPIWKPIIAAINGYCLAGAGNRPGLRSAHCRGTCPIRSHRSEVGHHSRCRWHPAAAPSDRPGKGAGFDDDGTQDASRGGAALWSGFPPGAQGPGARYGHRTRRTDL